MKGTIEDYRDRVKMYHGQLPAYTKYLYYDSQEFHVEFGSHTMDQSMMPILVKELCLVYVLHIGLGGSTVSISRSGPRAPRGETLRYLFFAGYGNKGHWMPENVKWIEAWFKENMLGVSPWEK